MVAIYWYKNWAKLFIETPVSFQLQQYYKRFKKGIHLKQQDKIT